MNHDPMREFAVKAFRARLERLGIDPLELIEAAILGRDSAASGQSPPSVHEILETAVTMSGDPLLALRIGEDIDLAAYGTYGFALMSCANIGASLEFFLRYGQTFLDSSSWLRIGHDDGLILRLEQTAGTNYQQMLVTESVFSNFRGMSEILVGQSAEGVRVYFNYPRPAHFDAYQERLSVPLEFDQEHTQIFLPNRWLSQSIRTGNPTTNVLFTQQCEEILQGMKEVKETTTAVRRLLIHSAGEFLNIKETSDQLHITERTLRRRLAAEGSDFRTIFDNVRNTLSKNYLSNTSLSVVDIAYLLDYGESTNFHRAFQRWNAMTPNEYRKHSDLSSL